MKSIKKSKKKPSRMGLASRICCLIQEWPPALIAVKYCNISFVLSVFPAPLSPLRIVYNEADIIMYE